MHLFLVSQVIRATPQYNYQNQNQSFNLEELYLFIGISIVVIAYFFVRRFINSHRGSIIDKPIISETPNITSSSTVASDSSLLLTMYTLGVGLTKVGDGKIQNYTYTMSITSPIDMANNGVSTKISDSLDSDSSDDDDSLDAQFNAQPSASSVDAVTHDDWEMNGMGRIKYNGPRVEEAPIDLGQIRTPANQILVKVNLPVASQVHIAGFSLQDDVFKKLLGNTNVNYTMSKVELEGDFPDYFRVYCQKDKEVEVREVLDPGTMEYLVDFCNQLNWELFENTLYFVQSGTNRKVSDNNSGVIKGAEDFITKVLPTLNRMQGNTSQSTPPVTNTPSTPPSNPSQPINPILPNVKIG